MMNFKTWLETDDVQVGDPRGPKPQVAQRTANKLVTKAMMKNPSFSANIMSAPNDKAKMGIIGDFTSGVIEKNKSTVNSAKLTPDVINQAAGDTVGFDYKSKFMKKGMKSK